VMRECNVDQPRNLAKSVTVEWFFPTQTFEPLNEESEIGFLKKV
jgi:hypothetical protein